MEMWYKITQKKKVYIFDLSRYVHRRKEKREKRKKKRGKKRKKYKMKALYLYVLAQRKE
jgi:hypothetical protein